MNQIYQRKQFKVYRTDDGYILHNSALDGFEHTHIDSFKQCKLLIELSIKKRIPMDLSRYLLISLYRINNGDYKAKIGTLIENKRKKDNYYNVNKGVNRK